MTLQHERPHDGVAEEHFLPSGPFATLPLTGNRCSIVWTERTGLVKTYLSMANEELIEEIEQRFGLKRGQLTILDRPKAFPLRIGMARRFIGPRLAPMARAPRGAGSCRPPSSAARFETR
jgi:2-octaprenyl-6-methoxyphenol hydroxylase